MKRRFIAFLLFVALFATAFPASALKPPAEEGWWTPALVVDYGLIAAGAGAYIIASKMGPRENALFGPRYDPENPTAIFDEKYAARIGKPHVEEGTEETVPIPHLVGMAAGMGGLLALQEGALWLWSDRGSAQMLHEVFVGYAEASALTGGFTEISKTVAGRLRPDFQDRAARHLCNTNPPAGFDCTAYEGRPLNADPEEAEHIFDDGRKSFWSGHSAFAFSTFMYGTLVMGGRWVWGEGATPTSRAVGLLTQMTFLGAAVFIAGSRIDDGRHHVTDVLVGSAAGIGLANFAYWRRFDSKGNPIRGKRAKLSLRPGPSAGLTLKYVP